MTESEEDAAAVGRDTRAPPSIGGIARGAPRVGCNGGGAADDEEVERKARAVARIKLCHELLRERRWRAMRAALAQLVTEQGEHAMNFPHSDYQLYSCGI